MGRPAGLPALGREGAVAVNAADAWQQSGRTDRPYRGPWAERPMAAERPDRAGRPRPPVPSRRSVDRDRADYRDQPSQYTRPPVPRRPEQSRPEQSRPQQSRPVVRDHDPRNEWRAEPRGSAARPGRRPAPAVETGGSKLRGVLGVLAVFLVTLAAAGVESFLSTGLGLITTVALIASTVVATFVVRRRDLLSVVVCPPLVFVAVATVNMIAAPSVHLSGVKAFGLLMITLLVQNFPAMAVATGAALVIGIIRLAARR